MSTSRRAGQGNGASPCEYGGRPARATSRSRDLRGRLAVKTRWACSDDRAKTPFSRPEQMNDGSGQLAQKRKEVVASNRRRAPAGSEMHTRLIEAAEDIICEQGHGALTSRTLAEKLSLKRQILHYYFESMDDLLVEIVRHRHRQSLAAFEEIARSEDPLRAIWQLSNDPRLAILSLELAALAARRPTVRDEVRRSAENVRAIQTRILADHLAARGIVPTVDPEIATIVISAISQTMMQEDLIGITSGHEKIRDVVERALTEFSRSGSSSIVR